MPSNADPWQGEAGSALAALFQSEASQADTNVQYGSYRYGSADRPHIDTGLPQSQIMPQDFMTMVQMTLAQNGVDPSKVTASQLYTIAHIAWDDSLIQMDWQASAFNKGSSSVIDFNVSQSGIITDISNQLFQPGTSSNTQLLGLGIQLKQSQNVQLDSNQQNYVLSSGANVPKPFQVAGNITQDFGDNGEDGIDYSMIPGTPLVSPFAGTIHIEDDGKANWGKRVFVKLSNGWTFAIGHLTAFSVQEGQQVNPGDPLGYSGGALTDPSSGNSTGPHIEVQWINPSGQFTDPHAIMDPILAGTTFGSINEQGAFGKGISVGKFPGDDPGLDSQYPGVVSTWQKYFGSPPTGQQILGIVGAGLPATGSGSIGAGQTTVQALAEQVGFTADESQIVAAISMAESGGDPTRDQYPGQNYGGIGLMQIEYEAHPDLLAKYGGVAGLHDPLNNLRAAYDVFVNAGRSFTPWTTFTGGEYKQFLGQNPRVTTADGTGLDAQQIEDRIRGLPSHIPGMNEGQYSDLRAQADQVSQKYFGHASTDGIVAELFHKKYVNPSDIDRWYGMQSTNDILNTPAYNQIYAANQGTMWGVYNESGFDPRVAAAQYQQAQAQAPKSQPAQASQTPAGLPIPGSGRGSF